MTKAAVRFLSRCSNFSDTGSLSSLEIGVFGPLAWRDYLNRGLRIFTVRPCAPLCPYPHEIVLLRKKY